MIIILFLFVFYIYEPDIERIIFVNELFSFVGFIIFIFSLTKGIKKNNILEILVLILIIYSGFHLIISIPFRENNYIFFRHTCILYSMFSFFLGSYLYRWKFRFINIFKYSALTVFLSNSTIMVSTLPVIFSGMQTTLPVFFNALVTRKRITNILILSFIITLIRRTLSSRSMSLTQVTSVTKFLVRVFLYLNMS